MLNGNRDLLHIQTDLQLPSEIPGTQVSVQWYLDSWELIAPDGTVLSEEAESETPVRLQAVLSLKGETLSWERELLVCPPEDPDSGQKIRMLQSQVQAEQMETDTGLVLPESVYGESVAWYSEMDDRWVFMGLLTAAAVSAMAIGKRREEERLVKEKEQSLQMDYPDIVSRLSLYMGAGMSTRKAWEKIVDSYERRGQKGPRPAYEEMRTTLH